MSRLNDLLISFGVLDEYFSKSDIQKLINLLPISHPNHKDLDEIIHMLKRELDNERKPWE